MLQQLSLHAPASTPNRAQTPLESTKTTAFHSRLVPILKLLPAERANAHHDLDAFIRLGLIRRRVGRHLLPYPTANLCVRPTSSACEHLGQKGVLADATSNVSGSKSKRFGGARLAAGSA